MGHGKGKTLHGGHFGAPRERYKGQRDFPISISAHMPSASHPRTLSDPKAKQWPRVLSDRRAQGLGTKLYFPYLHILLLLLLLLSRFSRVRICATPCFPVPGILQARTLEWVAISSCNA